MLVPDNDIASKLPKPGLQGRDLHQENSVNMALSVLSTPCTGICSTGIAGPVCLGCKRYAHEVIHWNRYSVDERRKIWSRINQLRDQVTSTWLAIVDRDLLLAEVKRRKIRRYSEETDLGLAYALLREDTPSLAACGLRCRAPGNVSVKTIVNHIDRGFQQLSEAHYQRYFSLASSS